MPPIVTNAQHAWLLSEAVGTHLAFARRLLNTGLQTVNPAAECYMQSDHLIQQLKV